MWSWSTRSTASPARSPTSQSWLRPLTPNRSRSSPSPSSSIRPRPWAGLTLNVLLSFAQFERELSAERVRDKVAASRRKGKWTGGTVPLGYDTKNKKLVINKSDAETVRTIFRLYLELGSFSKLVAELDRRKIVTKRRKTKVAKYQGGIPFTYGPLAYFLKNRIYIGETHHGGKWFKGEHEAILDRPDLRPRAGAAQIQTP